MMISFLIRMESIKNKTILKLIEKYKNIWALEHLERIVGWDLHTYSPEKAIRLRSEAFAKISSLKQELFLDKNFAKLIEESKKEKNLNDSEKAVVRILSRTLREYKIYPKEFLEEYAKVISESSKVWEKAKEEKNFKIFEPYLKKVFELTLKKAEYLGYKETPYDAILDSFEEGLTCKDVENYFKELIPGLTELFKYIEGSKNFCYKHDLEQEEYDIAKMEKLNKEMLKFLDWEDKNMRLDVSSHPFTMAISNEEARITTKYLGKNFFDTYASTIHEYGHALYELNGSKLLEKTPVIGVASYSLHESQSRLWERIIATNIKFIEANLDKIKKLGKNFEKYKLQDFYKYFNIVKKSLIRTMADEVTYHFHILIRFELEKEILENKIKIEDIPKIWKEKYKKYLGVEPKNDAEGVLQDMHWGDGAIGYFPNYSIGTSISAYWLHRIEKELGKIEDLIINEEGIKKIKNWLKENLHQYASTYSLKETLALNKTKIDPSYLLAYLNKKYKSLY